MASIRAPVFMLAAALALVLLAAAVQAKEFPHVEGMRFERNSMTRGAREEAIHARMFKDALAEYQYNTHRVPDENVKAQIAAALREHSMSHPLSEGSKMKVRVAPKRARPFSTADGGASPLIKKMDCEDMAQSTDATDATATGAGDTGNVDVNPTDSTKLPQTGNGANANPDQTDPAGDSTSCKATCGNGAIFVSEMKLQASIRVCICSYQPGSGNGASQNDDDPSAKGDAALDDMAGAMNDEQDGH